MAQRTRPRTSPAWAAAAALLLVAASSTVSAQSIGGVVVPPAAKSGNELTLRGSASGGYDGNDTDNSPVPAFGLSPLFQRSTTHFGGDVQLQFSAPGRRVAWGAGIGSAFRRYQTANTFLVNHNAAIGASVGLTPHVSVSASLFGGYSPPFQSNLFPAVGPTLVGQTTLLPIENSLSTDHLITYGSAIGLTYNMTKRTSLTLGHEYRHVRVGSGAFAGSVQDAYGAYHIDLTKGLGFHLGYRGQQYDYTDPATGSRTSLRASNLDIGLDYGLARGLTLSRKTTLTFGFGLASYTDRNLRLQFRAIGHLALTQQLFRTWSLTGGYTRGLTFLDGFGVPVFSDTYNARLSGQFSRRLTGFANAAYSIDRFDAVSGATQYRSYRDVVGIRANVTRQLDAFVQYVNYHHAFPEAAFLLQGALPTLNRQGVNAGLTFALPLIGNARTAPRGQPQD